MAHVVRAEDGIRVYGGRYGTQNADRQDRPVLDDGTERRGDTGGELSVEGGTMGQSERSDGIVERSDDQLSGVGTGVGPGAGQARRGKGHSDDNGTVIYDYAYIKGYTEGKDKGYAIGYQDGRAEAFKEATEMLKQHTIGGEK
jgi:hypothetical protein